MNYHSPVINALGARDEKERQTEKEKKKKELRKRS